MDLFSRATALRLQRSDEPEVPGQGDILFDAPEGDARVHGVVTTTRR